jgi:transposase
MAASRLHGDETTVPVLAKLKTVTGRLWTYVRDDRSFGGEAPRAAAFFYSRDRAGEHPVRHLAGYTGILGADAYAGPITEAACWSHSRRKFFELADIAQAARRRSQKYPAHLSPLALEAVRRIDRIFDIERTLNGLPHDQRLELRKTHVASLVEDLETWMRAERPRLSRHNPVAKAMDYMLARLHPLPRRRKNLPDQQCRRARYAASPSAAGIGPSAALIEGSDEAGHLFRREAGRDSDLKPATLGVVSSGLVR